MTARLRAETFPPSQFLRDEIEARGWSEETFAERLETDAGFAHEILHGWTRITPEIAVRLGSVFGNGDTEYG